MEKANQHDIYCSNFIIKELETALQSIKAYTVEQKCCLTETESFLLHQTLDAYVYHMKKRINKPEIEWENLGHEIKWDFIRELDFKPLSIEERHKWNRMMIK